MKYLTVLLLSLTLSLFAPRFADAKPTKAQKTAAKHGVHSKTKKKVAKKKGKKAGKHNVTKKKTAKKTPQFKRRKVKKRG